jgi:hypothetical protein
MGEEMNSVSVAANQQKVQVVFPRLIDWVSLTFSFAWFLIATWLVKTINARATAGIEVPIVERRHRTTDSGDSLAYVYDELGNPVYDEIVVGSRREGNGPLAGKTTEQRATAQGQLLSFDPGEAQARVLREYDTNACRNTIKPIALRAMSMPGRRQKGFKTMHRNFTYQFGKRITMKTIALCADSMPARGLKGLK